MSYVPPSMRNKRMKTSDQRINEEIEIIAQQPVKEFPQLCGVTTRQATKNENWRLSHGNNVTTNPDLIQELQMKIKTQEMQLKELEEIKYDNRTSTNPDLVYDLQMKIKRQERLLKDLEEIKYDSRISPLRKPRNRKPNIIVATEIKVEEESKADWIDPYAAKRRKNNRYNARKEHKRQQRLMRPPDSDSESDSDDEIKDVMEVSMWGGEN